MKKTLVTILFLLMLLTISACQPHQTPSPTESTPPVIATAATAQYYFIDGHFLGSFAADGWHSISDVQEILPTPDGETQAITARTVFTLREIAGINAYQLYTLDKFLGACDKIILPLAQDGLGCFGSDSDTNFTDDMAKALQQMCQIVLDSQTEEVLATWGALPLPADLTDTPLQELTMPYCNAFGYFAADDALDFSQYAIRLATSAPHNPLPQKVQVLYQLPEELTETFANQLTAMGIAKAPIHLTDFYNADFDHDGRDEWLLLLQTPLSDSGYPLISAAEQPGPSGAYCLVAYIDDMTDDATQTPQILFNWCEPYLAEQLDTDGEIFSAEHCRRLTFLGAYDLNGNGKLEFILRDQQWEWGAIRIYALDEDNRYHSVLVSNMGM